MASGKTTIGKHLGASIHLPFIDLDNYIEGKEEKSVLEIFKEDGEIYFRRKEHEYLKDLLSSDEGFVLSLGGGTPCYAGNMKTILQSKAQSFYLNATLSLLAERLKKQKANRPLVADLPNDKITEFVAKHLFERRPFYEQAVHRVSMDDKKVSEIVKEIRMLLY